MDERVYDVMDELLADLHIGGRVFVAFDVLNVDGHSLLNEPLSQRQALLAELVEVNEYLKPTIAALTFYRPAVKGWNSLQHSDPEAFSYL